MAKSKVPPDAAQRIKQLRATAGITQTRLAELLGVTPAAVSQWESNTSKPSAKYWRRIARAEALGIHALSKEYAPQEALKEPGVGYSVGAETPPDMTFSTDPEIVRLVMQCQRLAYGHQANPTFATEISQIQPLPHQRTAVYERMLRYGGQLQHRLRFLLADDAGAGKTIMAGLYIREMLSRRLLRRVLVVPPAGLVGNWESEMHALFSLPFRPIGGGDAQSGNPFVGPDSDLLIVSVDTLAGERMFSRLQEPEVDPYDLVIFDEAHKLSADREPDLTIRKTNRYRLAEALAGVPVENAADRDRWQLDWICRHLLLLTATPHMGKDFPYYCMWRLLEPRALSTIDAFGAYPVKARRRHFIRRTKEEMIDFAGKPIYPKRVSDTLSYDLTQASSRGSARGSEVSEQRLYDEMTEYMKTYYNQARMLNRSAARLAMSVFQRRLASSTYAMLRSLENRSHKLEGLIEAILSGEISEEELVRRQAQLDRQAHDILDETTADEESSEDGQEEHEAAEEQVLAGTVAVNLAQLQAERLEVIRLRDLARQVYEDPGHEDSKFAKLLEVMRDPRYRDEKIIIFSEHRDTLSFLVRRLEQLGYTGEIAQIHGGMPYKEREAQVAFFRKPVEQGGARYLVATDAAGEGINLQFCWLMVNYDIPWNPARLEQRMGRIHRYGQAHDPVIILNLVAGKTREGKVVKTLLDKLETIAKELGHGKVYDVVGKLFEGRSIKEYIERALTEEGAAAATEDVTAKVTVERVEAVQAQEQATYGEEDDPRDALAHQQKEREIERYRKLLPGSVRRFLQRAAPLLHIGIEGDLDSYFSLRPLRTGALDGLWPVLETVPDELRDRLTIYPDKAGVDDRALFVRPGEPLYDRLAALFSTRYGSQALQGSTFVDPLAEEPYLFHLALVEVVTKEVRLVGLRQAASGALQEVPVEHLLLLRGGPGVFGPYVQLAARSAELCAGTRAYLLDRVAGPMADGHREALLRDLPERLDHVKRGYDYREAELAEQRNRYRAKAREGDARAKAEMKRVRERQRALSAEREAALATLEHEPEEIAPGTVTFLAHALVMPSHDPEDRQRYSVEVELVAVREAWAYEEAHGADVTDVSTPQLAMAAGLGPHPGFDLLSRRPDGEERAIEVKGRARVGDVELKENEWDKACTHKDRYWLYVVYDCATANPRLWRVQNPFYKLIARTKGDVVVDESEILQAAEPEDG
jgi:superfamily II DNA or RNA helicase/transcriptional regulator with XRE-family HTH domain